MNIVNSASKSQLSPVSDVDFPPTKLDYYLQTIIAAVQNGDYENLITQLNDPQWESTLYRELEKSCGIPAEQVRQLRDEGAKLLESSNKEAYGYFKQALNELGNTLLGKSPEFNFGDLIEYVILANKQHLQGTVKINKAESIENKCQNAKMMGIKI